MSYTQTPNYGLYKPIINSDNDQWGTHLNSNADTIDGTLHTIATTVPSPATTTPPMDGAGTAGVATLYARQDHQHPTDTTRAPLNSPTFTGTVTIPAGAAIAGYAPLASPAFTGNPSLPTGALAVTQPAGNSSTAPATTAFVQSAVAPFANNTGRNRFHNATFQVTQRQGPFTTPGYTADRWYSGSFNGDSSSAQTVIFTDADRAQIGDEMAWGGLQVTFTGTSGATAMTRFGQGIEDTLLLSNKTVIISFYAKCASGTMRVGPGAIDQWFGKSASGASPDVLVPAQQVTITTTWTRYSVVQNIPSVAGKTLVGTTATYIEFGLSSGATNNAQYGNVGVQSGTITVWGLQCEVAQPGQTQPTPVDKVDYATEFEHCQRYYEIGYADCSGSATAASNWMDMPMAFNTRKVWQPTMAMTLAGSGNTNSQGTNVWCQSLQGFICETQAATTGYFAMAVNWTASADL